MTLVAGQIDCTARAITWARSWRINSLAWASSAMVWMAMAPSLVIGHCRSQWAPLTVALIAFLASEVEIPAATCAGVQVWSLYVPNGREVDSDHFAYKLAWLAALADAVGAGPAEVALCGDFNIAPADADVFDPAAYAGHTHVTGPERAALAAIEGLGLAMLPGFIAGPAIAAGRLERVLAHHPTRAMPIVAVWPNAAAVKESAMALRERSCRIWSADLRQGRSGARVEQFPTPC